MAQEAGEGMGRSQARSSSRAVEGLLEKVLVATGMLARPNQSINAPTRTRARVTTARLNEAAGNGVRTNSAERRSNALCLIVNEWEAN